MIRKVLIILGLFTVLSFVGCADIASDISYLKEEASNLPKVINVSIDYSDKRVDIYTIMLDNVDLTDAAKANIILLLKNEFEMLTKLQELL